ncbi:VWA domain-containing protein [Streptomyces sp. NPDC059740]|uniref:VWA domain-containing protein n=1 Tax=Streptomyces sp. NPDC059740 TaxID=3346926 RepID=UPI003665BCF5
MGIRSLLRNAFGRSKANRDEPAKPSAATEDSAGESTDSTVDASSGTAIIPEAREESVPQNDPALPAARTAPSEATADVTAEAAPHREADAEGTTATAPRPASGGTGASGAAPEDTASATPEHPTATEPSVPAQSPPRDTAAGRGSSAADASSEDASDLVRKAFDSARSADPAASARVATAEAKDERRADTADGGQAETEAEASAGAEEEGKAEAEATEGGKAEAEAPGTEETSAREAEPAAPAEAAAPVTAPAPEADLAPAPAAAPAAAAVPSPRAAAARTTALKKRAPGLVSLYKAAGTSLKKHGLAGERAAVYLVLDRSGSMRGYYRDGTVQHLAEQALGLSANFDDDGTVPVVFFSTEVDGTAELDVTSYEGRIEELHAGLGHMGRTNYHAAVTAVIEHYQASGSTAPAFVVFQTDGAPTSRAEAEKAICEAAALPIYWQFVGFGDPESKAFDFLRKLDGLTVPDRRKVANTGFLHAGKDPRAITDTKLYSQLVAGFPQWLADARAAGVVKDA